MTHTRAVNAAAEVILASLKQGKTLPISWAYALDSAQMLMSPEIAAELERLRARVAELEALLGGVAMRPADEDPIAYTVTDEAVAAVEQAARESAEVRVLLSREDSFTSPLHHDYVTPHDLPEVTP